MTGHTCENSCTYGKSRELLQSEGILNSLGNLNKSYDAANVMWGSPWRLPTKVEFEELKAQCTWEWTTYDGGKEGYKVTGPNGNAIFLPSKGFYSSNGEIWGYHWTASVYDDNYNAYYYNSCIGAEKVEFDKRNCARLIRPVIE